jgi:hypothetical protein
VAGDNPDTRDYAAAEFTVKQGDEGKPMSVAGKLCRQSYTPKDAPTR